MSVITVAVVILTSIAAAVYVSWPLLVGSRQPETGDDESERGVALDHLLVQKESIYSALKELEFDHAMGNLSGQDYRELVDRYEDRAVAVLKTIDHVAQEEAEGAEDPVEREVAALRRERAGASPQSGRRRNGDEIEAAVAAMRRERRRRDASHRLADDLEEEVAALRMSGREAAGGRGGPRGGVAAAGAPPCPACRAPLRSEAAAFCSRCGLSLRAACPSCRSPLERGDLYCSHCGAMVRGQGAEPVTPTTTGGNDA
jgi:hypothetical protein